VSVLGRRLCAVIAACSAALHGVSLISATGIAAVLAAAMLIACLYCARDLWTQGTLRAWTTVALMNLAMIALHLPMPAHHHPGAATNAPMPHAAAMTAATWLALIEVSLAVSVLFWRTRSRTPSQWPLATQSS
jgi:hypothetical protein